MNATTGYAIEKLVSAAASQDGRYISVAVELKGGQAINLLLPTNLCQALITGLISSRGAIHRQQIQAMGGEENVLHSQGFMPILPSAAQVARCALNDKGAPGIALRLSKDGSPMIDLALDLAGAKQVAEGILKLVEVPPATTKQ